jgi:ABC-type sulfate transport system permease component
LPYISFHEIEERKKERWKRRRKVLCACKDRSEWVRERERERESSIHETRSKKFFLFFFIAYFFLFLCWPVFFLFHHSSVERAERSDRYISICVSRSSYAAFFSLTLCFTAVISLILFFFLFACSHTLLSV